MDEKEEKKPIQEANDKKEEKLTVKDFFIKTLNGMAYGLFATLIIGTIFGTIGTLFNYGNGNPFCDFMVTVIGTGSSGLSYVLNILTGAGIGVGIAIALKFDPMKTIILAAVGELAGYFSLSTKFVTDGVTADALKVGDPLTIYLVCISVALLIKYVLKKKTPVDIILVPLFGVTAGAILSLLLRYPAIYVTFAIQWVINAGTNAVPFLMGIIVAVLMGMALTAPISSAAIAAMVFVIPASADPSMYQGLIIASGAAVIGCSTQMVGFAIQSRKDNNIGTVISIGIGTSMFQFKNILKKPVVWLPTIIASAILGPISTCWLKLSCMGSSAGMGTAGLVGQIGTIASMGADHWETWVFLLLLEIVLPGLLVFGIDLLFRKIGWIKEGDLKI